MYSLSLSLSLSSVHTILSQSLQVQVQVQVQFAVDGQDARVLHYQYTKRVCVLCYCVYGTRRRLVWL